MAGYKVKTRKAAAKRFKVKPSGKIKRSKANRRHLLSKRPRKRLNRLKKGAYVHPANISNVMPCLPNG